ncbi:MAG TPA: FHA domain-containing protein, partial [Candidatus Angelobacter sp.]|nr:FHA domain-containing protein [Candidatus Angelobacter sp.]
MATPSTMHSNEISLTVEVGGQQRRVVVHKSPFTVGRSQECDVVVPDFRVSRVHARLVQENGEHFILDAGSRH